MSSHQDIIQTTGDLQNLVIAQLFLQGSRKPKIKVSVYKEEEWTALYAFVGKLFKIYLESLKISSSET